MEGVAGISRPRRRLFPGGGSKSPLPSRLPSGGITPPSVGRFKGGEVPPASPPAFFRLSERCPVALHEDVDRAMVIESSPLDRHRPQYAPLDHRRRPRIRRLFGEGVSRSR